MTKLKKPEDYYQQSASYMLGWAAYENGVGRHKCLYPMRTNAYSEWLRGWDAAAMADPEMPNLSYNPNWADLP